MRKNELRRFANNQLRLDNTGSHRDKQHRVFVVNKIIHDLFKIGQCPPHWHALNQSHIQTLVQLWKRQRIKTVTVMKYMTVLRYFLQYIHHPIDNIDNISLGLIREKSPLHYKPINTDTIEEIANPFIKVILQLQIYFGLTFSEASRLIPDIHIRENMLWLTRDITFNHQDRAVPIRDDAQLKVLESFKSLNQPNESMIETHGHRAILRTHQRMMRLVGLSPKQTYRYIYAQHQYRELSKLLSHKGVSQIIMNEMGLKSRTTLWNYTHEQYQTT